jgi:hypothetical protein
MALNDTTICDSIGEYDDWVELYFEGYSTINLRGCGFSDNPAEPFRYLFDDDLFMSPGDYILIWCDNDPEQGVEHTNFRLSAGGEWIGIYSPASSGGSLLDSMSFPLLETDISYGRFCDGCDSICVLPYPTPQSLNNYTIIYEKICKPERLSLSTYPNPFNSAVKISVGEGLVPSRIEIFDINGRIVDDLSPLTRGVAPEAMGCVLVWKPDASVGSGVYLVRAKVADNETTKRIVYLK